MIARPECPRAPVPFDPAVRKEIAAAAQVDGGAGGKGHGFTREVDGLFRQTAGGDVDAPGIDPSQTIRADPVRNEHPAAGTGIDGGNGGDAAMAEGELAGDWDGGWCCRRADPCGGVPVPFQPRVMLPKGARSTPSCRIVLA